MEVKHNLVLYLTSPTVTAIDAVQGDGARLMACRLMDGMGPWIVPDGVSAGLSYTLPDKKDGFYDRLEDGTPAAVISGNQVTIVLDPVLTQQPGAVSMSLILRSGERQIATFPIRLRVAPAPGLVTADSLAPQKHGFDGKIYYGGPGGILIPLGIGDGVKVQQQADGTVVLVSEGGGLAKETDPTVPDWAKQAQKPTYTAQEVGALPASTKIPDKVSDLTNDSGFVGKSVNDLVNYYTKSQTQELIAAIPQFRVMVVQQLPAAGEERVLYLVPFAAAEGQFLEYIWVDGRFEVIGSQRVDLTGYATEEWVDIQLSGKLDAVSLSEAINEALAQAQKSGAFDGPQGQPGDDYVLTDDDMQEIAETAAELVDVPGAIQEFEQSHDLELITSFKLAETVSSLEIDKDANGESLDLETVSFELHVGFEGECGTGKSGAVGVSIQGAGKKQLIYLYNASGFDWKNQVTETIIRDAGVLAYATVRNNLGVARGKCGDFGEAGGTMNATKNYYYINEPIRRVVVNGALPANATIYLYGVRSGNNA